MRFLSWIFLLLTVVAVVLDWREREEDGDMVLRPLGEVWNGLHSESLQQFQPAVERHVSSGLWDSVIQPVLTHPAALSFGIAFLFFKVLSGLFSRPRGYHNVDPV